MNIRGKGTVTDKEISQLIKNSVRKLPDPEFDDRVLMKIQGELDYKNQVVVQLRTSLRFFIGALLAGVLLTLSTIFWINMGSSKVNTLAITGLFLFAVIAIMSIGNYRRLICRYTY